MLSIFDPDKLKPQKMFRYDRRLRNNIDVKELVDKISNEDMNLDVTTRISRCRTAIAAWSRDQYLNSRKAIERLKISLDAKISRPDADEPAIPPSALIYVRPIEPRRSFGSNEVGSSGLHWKIGTRVTSTHQPVEEEP